MAAAWAAGCRSATALRHRGKPLTGLHTIAGSSLKILVDANIESDLHALQSTVCPFTKKEDARHSRHCRAQR